MFNPTLFRMIAALTLSLTLQFASAQGADPAASSQARAIIEAQLEAFAADDAHRAFSFASPGIRARFGSAEDFMEMVRSSYPAVYRPTSVSFLPARTDSDSLLQPVSIADDAGRLWIAMYRLVKQSDSSWRIEACQLIQQPGSRT